MERPESDSIVNLHEGGKDFYEETMDYLRTKMLFANELCPTFLASIGCFIANEYQLSSGKAIYSYKGLPEDLCLHVAIVSPAGFSKGWAFRIFLNRTFGIIPFQNKTSGKVTEAGFVGTVKETGIIPGDAMKYAHGIIAFNEISNIFITSQSQHSGELINQVQEALSERHINKKLASGEIDFDTFLTLWGGSVLPHSPIIIRNGHGVDIIPISEACPGEQVLSKYGWQKVKSVVKHWWDGNMLGLNLHGSYVDITPNHSLFQDSKKVETGLLKIGEQVDMIEKKEFGYLNDAFNETDNDIPEDFAYIQGLFCADGWRKPGREFEYYICQKDPTVLYKIKDMVDSKFGNDTCSVRHYFPKNRSDMYYLYFYKKYGRQLGIDKCFSRTGLKKVPMNILNGSRDAKKSFFDGFIEGDGYDSKDSDNDYHINRKEFNQKNAREVLSLGMSILNPKMETVYIKTTGRGELNNPLLRLREANYHRYPLNQIRRIHTYPYKGWVYDVETESGTFLTGVPNLIVAHNTQPGRFDFSGGMERRFAFVTKAWTREDLEALKNDRRMNRDTKPDIKATIAFRSRFNMLKSMFAVDSIVFEDKMMEYLYDASDSHLRMQIMEKALIGKNVIDWKGEDELKIRLNDGNKDFVMLLKSMHEKVAMGSDISLMINVIGIGGMSRGELWNMFRRFGYTFEKFDNLLEVCLKLAVIGVRIDRKNDGIEKRFFVKKLDREG